MKLTVKTEMSFLEFCKYYKNKILDSFYCGQDYYFQKFIFDNLLEYEKMGYEISDDFIRTYLWNLRELSEEELLENHKEESIETILKNLKENNCSYYRYYDKSGKSYYIIDC